MKNTSSLLRFSVFQKLKKIQSAAISVLTMAILSSCSAEDPVNREAELQQLYYTVTIKEVCDATAAQQTRYCVSKETYQYYDTNKPDYCSMISFETLSGNVIGGMYAGIGNGTGPIPCED